MIRNIHWFQSGFSYTKHWQRATYTAFTAIESGLVTKVFRVKPPRVMDTKSPRIISSEASWKEVWTFVLPSQMEGLVFELEEWSTGSINKAIQKPAKCWECSASDLFMLSQRHHQYNHSWLKTQRSMDWQSCPLPLSNWDVVISLDRSLYTLSAEMQIQMGCFSSWFWHKRPTFLRGIEETEMLKAVILIIIGKVIKTDWICYFWSPALF